MTYIGPAATYQYASGIGQGEWDPIIMTAIAGAESGWNTTAKSPTDDWGLFQINRFYHQALFKRYTWYDPRQNTVMALAVWRSQHYRAWSTYNSGAYKRYYDQAAAAAGAPGEAGGAVLGPSPIGPAPGPGTDDYSGTVRQTAVRGLAAAARLHTTGHAINNLR